MTDEESCEPVPPRMSRIGLVAYCALPPLSVFVRIPNEPGRWILTHRCVVEVPCPVCHAVEGEPCHDRKQTRRYGTGTHADRRVTYTTKYRYHQPRDPHKPRLNPRDLEAAGSNYV